MRRVWTTLLLVYASNPQTKESPIAAENDARIHYDETKMVNDDASVRLTQTNPEDVPSISLQERIDVRMSKYKAAFEMVISSLNQSDEEIQNITSNLIKYMYLTSIEETCLFLFSEKVPEKILCKTIEFFEKRRTESYEIEFEQFFRVLCSINQLKKRNLVIELQLGSISKNSMANSDPTISPYVIAVMLREQHQLVHLDISRNEIDDEGMEILVKALEGLANLKSLDVSCNCFGSGGKDALKKLKNIRIIEST